MADKTRVSISTDGGPVFVGRLLAAARAKVDEYPRKRSAVMPLLHMLQIEVGYVTRSGMREIAALVELTPAEVFGTASFYSMYKFEPIGEHLVSVCTGITCQLLRGDEMFENLLEHYGVEDLETTADGRLTIEEVECLAACGGAPCLQVDYRFFENLDPEGAVALIDDVKARGLAAVFADAGSINAPLPPDDGDDIAAGPAALDRTPWAVVPEKGEE